MTDSHSFLPESAPASPVPDSVSQHEEDSQNNADEDRTEEPENALQDAFSHLSEAHRDVVRRLAHRVKQAVSTIEDLRAENERLRRRVEELEAQPDYPEDETILALDDDPDKVRERITQFINTIDTYLDTTATAPEDAVDDAPDA